MDAVPALLAGPLCVPVVFALLLALLNPYNVPCHTVDGDQNRNVFTSRDSRDNALVAIKTMSASFEDQSEGVRFLSSFLASCWTVSLHLLPCPADQNTRNTRFLTLCFEIEFSTHQSRLYKLGSALRMGSDVF